jgi:Zn-finger nucleic acid-binding protein
MDFAITCLGCGGSMEPRIFDGVEYDECPDCNAQWFDAGELRQILASAGLQFEERRLLSDLHLPEQCRSCNHQAQSGEVQCRFCQEPLGRSCPRDGRPMLIASLDDIELDLCPGCGGLWFDGEEFSRLLDQVHQGKHKWSKAG